MRFVPCENKWIQSVYEKSILVENVWGINSVVIQIWVSFLIYFRDVFHFPVLLMGFGVLHFQPSTSE